MAQREPDGRMTRREPGRSLRMRGDRFTVRILFRRLRDTLSSSVADSSPQRSESPPDNAHFCRRSSLSRSWLSQSRTFSRSAPPSIADVARSECGESTAGSMPACSHTASPPGRRPSRACSAQRRFPSPAETAALRARSAENGSCRLCRAYRAPVDPSRRAHGCPTLGGHDLRLRQEIRSRPSHRHHLHLLGHHQLHRHPFGDPFPF